MLTLGSQLLRANVNKMLFRRYKWRFLLIVLGTIQLATTAQATERISPNAWGIAKSKRQKEEAQADAPACPDAPTCDCVEDLGSIYYKKLVNYLFRKSRQIVDDFDGKHLINIHLQITEEQIKALRATDNVRDMDAIVSTVIENSRQGIMMETKEKLLSWYDQLHYFYLRVINSQTLTLCVLFGMFLCSVLCMRYIYKVNLIAVIVLNLLCVSLFFKYLDCNRRLEFENIERIKSLTTGPNPCERSSKLFGLSTTYDSQRCTDYMMSLHGHDRQFCEPVDVVSDYALNLIMKPMTKFLDSISVFVDTVLSKHGIIKGTVIILVVMCGMTYWMRDFLKTFLGLLWNGRPAQKRNRDEKVPAITKAAEDPQPSVVNVHINLDPRAIGDYVQRVKEDEEKSRPAICMPPSPSTKGIENIADGFDIITNEIEECPTLLDKVDEEVKKEK